MPGFRNQSRPRITQSWTVDNFKGVKSATIPLEGLSVIAGANSAGKSSLTQSLLLLAQSQGTDIVLNGPLVRFGGAKDVVNENSRQITFSWTFHVPRRIEFRRRGSADVEAQIELSPGSTESANGQSSLVVTRVSLSRDGEDYFVATNERVKAETKRVNNPGDIWGESLLRVKKINTVDAPPRTFVAFSGLEPSFLLYRKTPEDLAKKLWDEYGKSPRPPADNRNHILQDLAFNLIDLVRPEKSEEGESDLEALRTHLFGLLEHALDDDSTEEISDEDVRDALNRVSQQISAGGYVALPINTGTSGFIGPRYGTTGDLGIVPSSHAPDWFDLQHAFRILSSLSRRLRYIGPLREEPQVLSSTGGRNETIPAGLRGEYTADLLIRSRSTKVNFTDPNMERAQASLTEAVGTWAAWLGVGQAVKVTDQGKLGRGIIVVVDGKERDLTTIGVGVSQLLPVITLVLAAAPQSVIILEQPELHLHPAVQSKLANFLVYARPDITIVVETHSEYLITRLRRLHVSDTQVENRVSFLFAEPTPEGAIIDRLPTGRLGDITEWPPGFFDTQDDEERLLLLALRERDRRHS